MRSSFGCLPSSSLIFTIMQSFSSTKIAAISILLICYLKSTECHVIPDRNLTENLKANTLINLLNAAQGVLQSAKEVAIVETRSVTESSFHPMDCAEIQERSPSAKIGIYKIWPRNRVVKGPISVPCQLSDGDDGGAWTVIQRRGDYGSSKDYFYRNWSDYKNGFGDVSKDFWIVISKTAVTPHAFTVKMGLILAIEDYKTVSIIDFPSRNEQDSKWNDNIFALTNQRPNTVKFVMADWENNVTVAEYEEFWIDDEYHNYTMRVSGYRGNAGDGFSFTNGMAFTTRDKDNDLYEGNCAVKYKGAWWYAKCHSSNLNGQYLKGAHESHADGVNWSPFRGPRYSLMGIEIKIRPRDFVRKFAMDATPQ